METYAQRKSAVLRQVRSLKRALNQLNAALERARRETDRLVQRKTLITPESLHTLQEKDDQIFTAMNLVQAQEATLNEVASSYL